MHAVVVKEQGSARHVFAFCDQAPSEESRDECKTHSIGIMAAGINFDLKKAGSEICGVISPYNQDFQNHCYAQLVASTLSTIPNQVPQVAEYCGSIPKMFQKTCFTMIGNSLQNLPFTSSEKKSFCQAASNQFQELCREGGNIDFIPHSTHEED